MTIRLDAHKPEFHRAAPPQLPVRVATTANITIATALNAGDSVDGVTLAAGDRVLVKDQSTGAQNGVYIAGVTPARAFDMEEGVAAYGAIIYVVAGTANGGKLFRNTNTTVPTIGSTALTFADYTPGSGGGMDLGWFNAEDYGAVHNGSTDDTVAIQAAIDACMAAGGGTVWFPAGIYQISGALVSTSTYNSQLTIPQVGVTGSTTPRPIRFLGAGPVTPTSGYGAPANGSILRSDWNGSITGHPAIISAGLWGTLPGGGGENGVQIRFEEIGIQYHDNPKLSAIQAQAAKSLSCHRVLLQPSVDAGSVSLPTNTNAVGIDMPLGLSSQFPDSLYDVAVEGIYTGVVASEQACGDNVGFAWCAQAMSFVGHQGTPDFTRHANHFGKVLASLCPRVLVFTADQRWVYIDMLNIEHDNAPFASVYDIDDASNYARGFVGWHATDYTTGPTELNVNGATGLSLHGGYVKRWVLNNVVDIPTGTDAATNPATGRRLYTASATGHLIGRDSAGTLYDYEKLGGTVALTGTPSSGQVPTATSSSAATWQTPSSSGTAGHYEVIVSGTAPPVAVTNVAEDDWVYGFVPD